MLFARYQHLFSSEVMECLTFNEVFESLKEVDGNEDIIAFTYSSLFHERSPLNEDIYSNYKISYMTHVVTLNEIYTISLECENISLNKYKDFINNIKALIDELSVKNNLTVLSSKDDDAATIAERSLRDNYSVHPGALNVASIESMRYNIVANKIGTEKYIITLNDSRKSQILIYKSDAEDLCHELEKLGRYDLLLGQ